MSALIDFQKLVVGKQYDRPELAIMWGYKGHQALSRGVVTPVKSNVVMLFVTKKKQASLPQYSDYIIDDFLYWDSESKGGNNLRIINAKSNGDEVYLFYRAKHHQPFIFKGRVEFIEVLDHVNLPHQFLFKVLGEIKATEELIFEPIFPENKNKTQSRSLALSRVGQGKFRTALFKLWDGCAVSHIDIPELLKASHIKPWKDSNDSEKLDPYNGLLLSPIFDTLFDKGFISFDDDGKILLSSAVMSLCEKLNISGAEKLTKVYSSSRAFLRFHRENILLK
ncbi:HNH endonuclease [Pedobacter sp. GR22-6]|uniref:HNH endonuclease n=1 Tax=Pedobacter sp. GR22-6 TaxID=3127957 RepID=UPI00307D06BA